jgi:hypothetical protein
MAIIPPAAIPQNARAVMKLSMLCASAHHPVVTIKPASAARYTGRRPIVSDSRPNIGWNDVDVSMKAVDSHDAALDARKYDVMTGWLVDMK